MASEGRVLVIDDDADFLDFVRIILESRGYEVITTESVEEGQRVWRKWRPDVVLVDCMISYVLDGLNMISAVRADPELGATPIVLISAIVSASADGLLPSGERLECDAFISKPVAPDELLRTVEALARRSDR